MFIKDQMEILSERVIRDLIFGGMVLEKDIIRIITMSTGITELPMIGMIDILSSDESWTASS